MKQVSSQEFDREVKEAKGLVVVDFFATWCGPCKMLSPILEDIAKEMPEIKIVSVDIDKQESLAMDHQVMSVPTLVLYKDGKKVDQMVGLMPKSTIKEKLNYFLN